MLPVISIFNLDISMYAITFAIGIIFDFLLIIYIKKFFDVKTLDVICCFPYWLIFFFVGAKFFYIVENMGLFFNEHYNVLSSGFSFTGGIIGGFLGIILYCKQYKVEVKYLLRLYTIVFPITYSFGKIGCYLVGCCNSIYNFPLQLIESLISFIITIYIFLKVRDNSIVYKYLILYSVSRFSFDFFRETRKIIFMNFSFIQLMCISIVIFCVYVYLVNRKYMKNSIGILK